MLLINCYAAVCVFLKCVYGYSNDQKTENLTSMFSVCNTEIKNWHCYEWLKSFGWLVFPRKICFKLVIPLGGKKICFTETFSAS